MKRTHESMNQNLFKINELPQDFWVTPRSGKPCGIRDQEPLLCGSNFVWIQQESTTRKVHESNMRYQAVEKMRYQAQLPSSGQFWIVIMLYFPLKSQPHVWHWPVFASSTCHGQRKDQRTSDRGDQMSFKAEANC